MLDAKHVMKWSGRHAFVTQAVQEALHPKPESMPDAPPAPPTTHYVPVGSKRDGDLLLDALFKSPLPKKVARTGEGEEQSAAASSAATSVADGVESSEMTPEHSACCGRQPSNANVAIMLR